MVDGRADEETRNEGPDDQGGDTSGGGSLRCKRHCESADEEENAKADHGPQRGDARAGVGAESGDDEAQREQKRDLRKESRFAHVNGCGAHKFVYLEEILRFACYWRAGLDDGGSTGRSAGAVAVVGMAQRKFAAVVFDDEQLCLAAGLGVHDIDVVRSRLEGLVEDFLAVVANAKPHGLLGVDFNAHFVAPFRFVFRPCFFGLSCF